MTLETHNMKKKINMKKRFNFQPLLNFFQSTKDNVKNNKLKWTIGLVVALMSGYIYSPSELKTSVQSGLRSATELFVSEDEYRGEALWSDYKIDGRTDTEALQAMFDEAPIGKPRAIYNLENRTIRLNEAVHYRYDIGTNIHLLKNGRIIQENDNADIIVPDTRIKGMHIGGSSDPNNVITHIGKFDVENVWFEGGRNQLVLAAQRNSIITNSKFRNGVRGILGIFCQQCVVRECNIEFHAVEGIVWRSGSSDGQLMAEWSPYGVVYDENNGKWFTNSNLSNSSSNRCLIENTWFFSKPDQICLTRVQVSDGTIHRNNIYEGAPALYCIYNDSKYSTTCHSISIENPHLEQGNPNITKALIYNEGTKGLHITGLFSQIEDVTIVEFQSNHGGQMIMDEMSWIPWTNESFKFNKDNIKAVFNHPLQNGVNFTNAKWSNVVPKDLFYSTGTNMFGVGQDGLGFRSKYWRKGKIEESFIIFERNQLKVRGIEYIQRPTGMKILDWGSVD
jgi:hypothetical protein